MAIKSRLGKEHFHLKRRKFKMKLKIIILCTWAALICALLPACGTEENNETVENNVAQTEAPTELTPTNQKVPDTGNFLKVRGDMSPEEIVELMGIPTDIITITDESYPKPTYAYIYLIDEINLPDSELLNGLNDDITYKFYFCDESDTLEQWQISASVNKEFTANTRRSNVIKFMNDTIFPDFKTAYPELELNLVPDTGPYWSASADIQDYFFSIEYYDDNNNDYMFIIDFLYFSNHSGSSGNYDPNDEYYKNNDSDNDGYIDDDEFQNAVGDWMDDHGY